MKNLMNRVVVVTGGANGIGCLSTEYVADLVVAGMAAGKTHIFPSPEWLTTGKLGSTAYANSSIPRPPDSADTP